MPVSFDTSMQTDDNPFGVQIEHIVRSGTCHLQGYHDNSEEGYITAIFFWKIDEVSGIVPLLLGSEGDMGTPGFAPAPV